MSEELRKQIYNNLNLKETGELLEIWRTNDRVEWSDDVFEIIREILSKRGVETPEQDEPIYEHIEQNNDSKIEKENLDFSEFELKILDDENPPDFYDPFEALKIAKWLDLAAKAMAALTILGNLLAFQTIKNIFSAYFPGNPDSFFVYAITILSMAINIVIVIPIYYLPLRALSQFLRILVEMEFNSRRSK